MRNLFLVIAILFFYSCSDTKTISKKEETISFQNEIEFAEFCFQAIKEGKYTSLAPYVEETILFSPYAYIEDSTAREMTLENLSDKNKVYFWGYQDGSGHPILLTSKDYIETFVLGIENLDNSVRRTILNEEPPSYGSELHNVHTYFKGETYVEFYKPATDGIGFNWHALIFVINKKGDTFILKAIINNIWTT